MINLDLSGKVAVVTGASRELGRVIGRTLAEAGAAVALHYYRSEDKAQATATEVNAAGGKAMIVQADVILPRKNGHPQAEIVDMCCSNWSCRVHPATIGFAVGGGLADDWSVRRMATSTHCIVMAMLSRRSPPMLSEHLPDLKYSAGLIGPVAPRRAMSVV